MLAHSARNSSTVTQMRTPPLATKRHVWHSQPRTMAAALQLVQGSLGKKQYLFE
jgi:hypothetical protein